MENDEAYRGAKHGMINRRQLTTSGAAFGASLWLGGYRRPVFAQPNGSPDGPLLRVGSSRTIKTITEAATVARAGSTIEVDAGDYAGDVAVWERDGVTVRAVGGRVRLLAQGAAAEGKGIWVVRASGMRVEGFDFEGAAVPSRNGAGIRLETGSLLVRDCRFMYNEMGLLTNNHPGTLLQVENSEFGHNGYGDGLSHNLYAGAIARLSVTGSYFHHARVGHLLKSRAAVNSIAYNRLTDELEGRASYELEFPDGGVAYVIGNVIQQGPLTENPHLVSFGAEGYRGTVNALYLVNNTLVDNKPQGGVFLRVKPGDLTVKAFNNLLAGQGSLESAGPGVYHNNFTVDLDEFELSTPHDYRLKRGSRLSGKVVEPGYADAVNLLAQAQYLHPRSTQALVGKPHNPGAVQNLLPAAQP